MSLVLWGNRQPCIHSSHCGFASWNNLWWHIIFRPACCVLLICVTWRICALWCFTTIVKCALNLGTRQAESWNFIAFIYDAVDLCLVSSGGVHVDQRDRAREFPRDATGRGADCSANDLSRRSGDETSLCGRTTGGGRGPVSWCSLTLFLHVLDLLKETQFFNWFPLWTTSWLKPITKFLYIICFGSYSSWVSYWFPSATPHHRSQHITSRDPQRLL